MVVAIDITTFLHGFLFLENGEFAFFGFLGIWTTESILTQETMEDI